MTEETKVGIPTPADLTEAQDLQSTVENIEIELDGKIFLVQKNALGEEVLRDELDGEVILKLIMHKLTSFLDTHQEDEETEESLPGTDTSEDLSTSE